MLFVNGHSHRRSLNLFFLGGGGFRAYILPTKIGVDPMIEEYLVNIEDFLNILKLIFKCNKLMNLFFSWVPGIQKMNKILIYQQNFCLGC